MLNNKNIIIDFKAISPKDGDLFGGRNPLEVARSLEKAGVLGLSVVTEAQNFGGSLKFLRDICNIVSLPVLRKDFIKTEKDLQDTVDCGAQSVLLIVATVPDIEKLYAKSLELKLIPVVEVHSQSEMEIAKKLGAKVIGINNKDITNLEKDSGTVEKTVELIKSAPPNAFVISESGIKNRDDAQRAIDSGAGAVLVGTAFWKGEFVV
ncbi:MAG: indole-3-glycerol-phosphate synthase [Fibromonadaceae bacterium]|jgi:indole-3-glycerol phosphate synthase|nr:indole-3-glycerol-phosphate synthase [Fibromonadaceae bacterium]